MINEAGQLVGEAELTAFITLLILLQILSHPGFDSPSTSAPKTLLIDGGITLQTLFNELAFTYINLTIFHSSLYLGLLLVMVVEYLELRIMYKSGESEKEQP